MKICLVNPDFIPMRGSGQAVYAEKIARGLAVDHDVTVIASKIGGNKTTERIENIRVIRIPVPGFDPSQWIGFGHRAGKFLYENQFADHFDIVHFLDGHIGYAYQGSFVATLHQSFNQRLKGNKGLPYASSLFNLIKRHPYYICARSLEKKALKSATGFIAVSGATRSEFIENYAIDPRRIELIYNGIDTTFFQPTDGEHLKKKLGLGAEIILLYVGFSTPRKGVETLIQALPILKTQHIKLIIVGKWEKGYRERALRFLGKNRAQLIETGYIEDRDMPAYYSLADVFILPSLLEGFGFPLVESLSCGTPVISTNVGSIPEVVGDCGIVISPQNPCLLAETIDRLLADKPLIDTFKSRSRQRVLENFSESVMIGKTIEFYRKSISVNKGIAP